MRRWRARFVLLAILWGFWFVLINIGEMSFAPLQVVLGRMLAGALTLVTILHAQRRLLPRRLETWGHLMVASVLLNILPFSLLAYGMVLGIACERLLMAGGELRSQIPSLVPIATPPCARKLLSANALINPLNPTEPPGTYQ